MAQSDVIKLLWGAFPDSLKIVADEVLSAEGKPLQEQLSILTRVERKSGLPVHLFGLVAAAKKALIGKDEDIARFKIKALKNSGLI